LQIYLSSQKRDKQVLFLTHFGSLQLARKFSIVLMLVLVFFICSIPAFHVASAAKRTVFAITMCKNVVDGRIIGEETHSFLYTDETAFLYFKVEFSERETVQAKSVWYEPSGKIYNTGWWTTTEAAAGDTWTFWARLSIRGRTAAERRGYWRVEVFFGDELLFTEKFTIGPFYTVEVFAQNLPAEYSVPMTIDGESWGPIRGGERKPLGFAPGTTHSISVGAEVLVRTGTRYYASDNSRIVSSEGSIIFKYDLQYRLEAKTDPLGVTKISGEGWYAPGSTVTVGDAPKIVEVSLMTRWVLVEWIVDGVATPQKPSSFTMDSPHQVVTRYKKQHYLTVSSQYGDPRGEGWYDEGATAEFSVTSPAGFLIQQVLVSWTGDVSTTSPKEQIVMNGPKTVTAQWRTDYTQLYVAVVVAVGISVGLVVVIIHRRRREAAAPAISPVPSTPTAPSPLAQDVGIPAPESPQALAKKFCMTCGEELSSTAGYCTKCGAKQES